MDINALNSVRKQPGGQRGATENIPLQVERYDLSNPQQHLVIGTRLDTGEEVSVFLRPDADAAGRKKPRPEVADFASENPKVKVRTEVGGIIRFDRSYEQKDQPGVYSAFWAQSLSHYPGEANVMTGLARVLPPKDYGDGMMRQATEVIFNDHAIVAKDLKSLRGAVESALGAEVPGAQGAYLRLEANGENGPEVISFRIGSSVNTDADGEILGKASPAQSFDNWAKGAVGKVVVDQIEKTVAAGKPVEIEVVPMTRLNVGADTVTTSIEKHVTLDEGFKFKDGNGYGFAPASIATRSRENGSVFVTDVKPLSNGRVFYTVENIPTVVRGGEPAPVESADLSAGQAEELEFDAADVPPGPAPRQAAPLASLDGVTRRAAAPRR